MMAALPTIILPKVGALLRLLGSPIDGEALGAARALGRTLQGAGVDWHALADAVERPAVVMQDAPQPKVRRGRKARPGDVELDQAQCRRVVAALQRGLAGGRMSEWEAEFTHSIVARLQAGHGRLTERQGETLARLLGKLGEGRAWA